MNIDELEKMETIDLEIREQILWDEYIIIRTILKYREMKKREVLK